MAKLTLEIPDELISLVESHSQPIQEIIVKALENYLTENDHQIDIKKTRTWKLCGSLQIAHPLPEYIVNGEEGNKTDQIMTNYAENIDHVLY